MRKAADAVPVIDAVFNVVFDLYQDGHNRFEPDDDAKLRASQMNLSDLIHGIIDGPEYLTDEQITLIGEIATSLEAIGAPEVDSELRALLPQFRSLQIR